MNLRNTRHQKWPHIPAWAVLSERDEFGGTGPLLSLSTEFGIRERSENEGRAASEDLSGYRRVLPGDLVVNRLVARDGAFAVSGLQGLISPAYWVLRARQEFDTRFVNYLLHSSHYLAEITARSKAMPPAQFDLPWEQFRTLPISAPDLATQRRIADYLDTEIARIDALITKKQRMAEVVIERENLALARALDRRNIRLPRSLDELESLTSLGDCRVMRLSQCLEQLTNGYVGPTRDILVDDGVPYIQSLHIKNGSINFKRRPFFVTAEWHASRPRIHLRESDVLIVQTGDIGQVAVVPPGFGEASCHALQIARVRSTLISGPYLAEYLRSSIGYQSLLSRATGALHPHLEGGIRTVPILVPPIDAQRAVVREITEWRQQSEKVASRLRRQLELLRERRQALITAAVTGDLEIPRVAA